MQTLASLTVPAVSAARQAGYTLFELLIVMAMVGLAGALVVPNLPGLGDALTRNQQVRDLELQLTQLPDLAFASATNFHLSPPEGPDLDLSENQLEIAGTEWPRPSHTTAAPLILPEGWTLTVQDVVFFFRNGLCSGGVVTLENDGREFRYEYSAPLCDTLKQID